MCSVKCAVFALSVLCSFKSCFKYVLQHINPRYMKNPNNKAHEKPKQFVMSKSPNSFRSSPSHLTYTPRKQPALVEIRFGVLQQPYTVISLTSTFILIIKV